MRSASAFGRSYFTLRGNVLLYETDYGRQHLTAFRMVEHDGRFLLHDEHGRVSVDITRATARYLHIHTHDAEPT